MTISKLYFFLKSFHLAPTALIPFCQFQGSMAVMGVHSPNFSVPVCNSFKAKVRGDQLCYTVDPNVYKVYDNEKPLELTLLLDYNEEREYSFHSNSLSDTSGNYHSTLTIEETEKRFIIIEAISKN